MLLNCFYCLVLSSFVVCYKQFSDGKIIALNIGEGSVSTIFVCSASWYACGWGVIANDVLKMRKVIAFQSSWITIYYKIPYRILLHIAHLCRWSIRRNSNSNRQVIYSRFRSSRPEVFCRKRVLKNFAKFSGKHLCRSLL